MHNFLPRTFTHKRSSGSLYLGVNPAQWLSLIDMQYLIILKLQSSLFVLMDDGRLCSVLTQPPPRVFDPTSSAARHSKRYERNPNHVTAPFLLERAPAVLLRYRFDIMLSAIWRRCKAMLLGEPPSSKAERILLAKVDWFILSYCCFMVRIIG